jgi:hypothetical protein
MGTANIGATPVWKRAHNITAALHAPTGEVAWGDADFDTSAHD